MKEEGCGKVFKVEGMPYEYLNWKEATYKKQEKVSIREVKWIKNLVRDKSGKSHRCFILQRPS